MRNGLLSGGGFGWLLCIVYGVLRVNIGPGLWPDGRSIVKARCQSETVGDSRLREGKE